jgi:hypothetical protein
MNAGDLFGCLKNSQDYSGQISLDIQIVRRNGTVTTDSGVYDPLAILIIYSVSVLKQYRMTAMLSIVHLVN